MSGALVIGLFVLGYLLVLAPFALLIQWVTRWVAGFTPGFWQTLGALIVGGILGVVAQFIVVLSAGMSPDPSPGLVVAVCVVPLLIQALVCGVMLKDPSGNALGFGRALVVNIVNSFILVLVMMVWVLPAVLAKAKSREARAPAAAAGSEGPLPSPSTSPPPSVPKATPMPMFPARRFATSGEAQQEAVRLHPALGIEGSDFNRAFVARYRQYQRERPGYFSDTSWPLRLADEIARAGSK